MTSTTFITKFIELWREYEKQNKKTDEPTECAYIVALDVGGEMGAPDQHYQDFDIIYATSASEARIKYDKKYNCSYYYGRTICKLDEVIPNKAVWDAIYQNNQLREENDKLYKMINSLRGELLGDWYPRGGLYINETKEIFDKIIEKYKKEEGSE